MPKKDNASLFRNTAKFFRTTEALLNKPQSPNDVRKLLQKAPPRIQTEAAMSKYNRQVDRFATKWKRLPVTYQALRLGAGMIKAHMQDAVNRSMIKKKQVSDQEIHRVIKEPKTGQGKELGTVARVDLVIDADTGVPYEHVKGTHEYRDPAKQGYSTDPIHQGAKAQFPRYAITALHVAGKKLSAGRKGTEYQGIGLEPPLDGKDRTNYSKKDYKAFIRKGYPQRQNPDLITNDISFPVYSTIWGIDEVKDKILKDTSQVVSAAFRDYRSNIRDVLDVKVKELNQENM